MASFFATEELMLTAYVNSLHRNVSKLLLLISVVLRLIVVFFLPRAGKQCYNHKGYHVDLLTMIWIDEYWILTLDLRPL